MKYLTEVVNGVAKYATVEIDGSNINTGIIDPARLPPTEGVVVTSGDITTLTAPQQAAIAEGTLVILGAGAGVDAGKSYRYTGTGSKTSLASYVEQQTAVSWASVTGKPDSVASVGLLTPLTDRIAYYTGAATAALAAITAFGRSLIGAANEAAVRAILHYLPDASPTVASGKLTAAAATAGDASLNVPNGVSPTSPATGDIWADASRLFMQGRILAVTKGASNSFGAGASLSVMDAANPTKGAHIQLNEAGGMDIWTLQGGSWVKELTLPIDGSIQLANLAGTGTRTAAVDSTGKLAVATAADLPGGPYLPVTNPIATGTLTAPDVVVSNLAGSGTRPMAVDSTGLLVVDPRAGVQSGSGAIAINASTKRMLRVTGTASLQLGSPASCAEVTVEVTAAFNGDIGITGEHQYCDTSPAYWYYSSTGRVVTVGNFGSDGPLRKFTLSCDGVHWYFKG